MDFSKLHYYVPVKKSDHPKSIERDLIIYGGSPAGITAAVQAVRKGLSVAIAEFGRNVGGISASGLGATDLGAKEAIGGLSREFYQELGKYYQTDEQWTFEPKAAQYVFNKWLKDHEIDVFFEQHLEAVKAEDGEIKEIFMENGNVYKGDFFIDASYEGDLLANAEIGRAHV